MNLSMNPSLTGDGQCVLKAEKLAKRYVTPGGNVQVLRSVDLSVMEGEFVAITGPSGSGKTTFLNMAALLDRPTSGNLFFSGLDVNAISEKETCELRRSQIGMVFQQFHLLPRRTVFENVMFRFRYLGGNKSECELAATRALESLNLIGLSDQPARLLSGGEMQRVAIARAVAVPPRLLVVDEPTGNLDKAASIAVMEAFRSLNRSGITILMVTHNESILEYCTRCLACEDGRILEKRS
ncbi:MAG: ABC transporter ATP-binding protein [Lentisphaerae bacterium]|nr:ABC transporter ATP-binding protein [Lentisphaerota bacterium]